MVEEVTNENKTNYIEIEEDVYVIVKTFAKEFKKNLY